MLRIGCVGVFLPLLAIEYCHIGDTTFGRNKAWWIIWVDYFPMVCWCYIHINTYVLNHSDVGRSSIASCVVFSRY